MEEYSCEICVGAACKRLVPVCEIRERQTSNSDTENGTPQRRMLPIYYDTEASVSDSNSVTDVVDTTADSNDKEIISKALDDEEFELEQRIANKAIPKKPCAIVVLSNIQNPSMQSLLRKYRYDANGILIPSSVKYFIKLPQGLKSQSILVPLNDKAFSPLGGFVRYYKEVPPIPHAW